MGSDHRSPARRSIRSRGAVALVALAGLLMVGGCGLRLETPAPAPLVPGELEQVRQRATADALAVQVMAEQAAAQSADGLQAALTAVHDVAVRHLDALGGIYDPGPVADGTDVDANPSADPSSADPAPAEPAASDPAASDPAPADPAASPSADPPAPAVTAADVIALLTDAAASARADAAGVPDGPLARLLCSIAVSRHLSADALRAAAGLPPPDQAAVSAAAPFEVPAEVPAGVSPGDVLSLVQSEDGIAMAWEVVAARSADETRVAAAARAQLHRFRAEAWAVAGGIQGTGLDPRRSAYDLPDSLIAAAPDPALMAATLAGLEGELVVDYTSLVASADPGARSPFVDAALDAARAQVRSGGVAAAFPGMPEQAP